MSLENFNDQNDLESSLLQQFSCMSTSNKDDLIKEFQRLLAPNQLNVEGCTFFLEMNNYNLQQAICSYFDYDQHKLLQQPLPVVSFIGDVTIGEGEEVAPNTKFVKIWKIANSGTTPWPSGCYLTFLTGYRMSHLDRVLVDALKPGEQTDVSVSMISPQEFGTYQGQWRMCTSTGQYFGDIIWCIITVNENGLLSLTQQMNEINVLGSAAALRPNENNDNQQIQNPFELNHSYCETDQLKSNSFTERERHLIEREREFNDLCADNNLAVQRILDSTEMQIDEDNKN